MDNRSKPPSQRVHKDPDNIMINDEIETPLAVAEKRSYSSFAPVASELENELPEAGSTVELDDTDDDSTINSNKRARTSTTFDFLSLDDDDDDELMNFVLPFNQSHAKTVTSSNIAPPQPPTIQAMEVSIEEAVPVQIPDIIELPVATTTPFITQAQSHQGSHANRVVTENRVDDDHHQNQVMLVFVVEYTF